VAQDVADLSHEVAEWADDPFGRTSSPCPSYPLLEVGDPLLGQQHYYSYSGANNGFSYHLQDLVMLPFFRGADRHILEGLDHLSARERGSLPMIVVAGVLFAAFDEQL